MKRSQSDREIREDVTPGASAGAGIESESEDDCTSTSDHEAGSGYSDMEVSDSGTANKKTSKSKLISENRGKLYNPKKHKGAYRYKTKFDDKWLKKHPGFKGNYHFKMQCQFVIIFVGNNLILQFYNIQLSVCYC
jgi:hypothetical protein